MDLNMNNKNKNNKEEKYNSHNLKDNWVKVFEPATIANVGPGFDIFGLALTNPGDYVTARKVSNQGISIKEISGDSGKLPLDTLKNTAGIAAYYTMKLIKKINQIYFFI